MFQAISGMIWVHIENSDVRRIHSPDLEGAKRGNRKASIDTATSITTANTGNSHLMKNFADHNRITVAKVSMRLILVMS
jgi:hypothetical protein